MVIILNLEALSYLEFLSGYEGTMLIQIRSLPKVADQAVFRPNMHLYPHIRIREEYSKSSYYSIVLEYSVLKFLIIEFVYSQKLAECKNSKNETNSEYLSIDALKLHIWTPNSFSMSFFWNMLDY